MRKFKKIMAAAAAAVMTLAMTVSAFADTTIKKADTDTHTYNVYQIFTGTEESGKLKDIRWGVNGTGYDDSIEAPNKQALVPTGTLKALENLASQSDIEKATKIKESWKSDSTPIATINNTNNITGTLASGYYLIQDTTDVANANDAKSFYVVRVLGTDAYTIEPKKEVPTVSKYIKEDSTNTYGKTADFDQNQDIPFSLVATLPSAGEYARYSQYKVKFTDTLTNMNYKTGTISVKVYSTYTENTNTGTVVGELDLNDNSNIAYSASGNSVTVTINNTKSVKYKDQEERQAIASTDKIVVNYDANFTEDAITGSTGNVNTVKLTFSNDPTSDQYGDEAPTGDTPEDKAYAFKYELDLTKVDSTNHQTIATSGKTAEFKLYKKVNNVNNYAMVVDGKLTGWTEDSTVATTTLTTTDGTYKINGLDQGEYYLKETKAPEGYTALTADIKFTISATYTYNDSDKTATITTFNLASDNSNMTNITAASATGIVAADIINIPTSSLPTTGGIGTKLFYIVGGAMMFAAAALLVVKKLRRNA